MKAKLFDRENNFIKDHTVPYAIPVLRMRLFRRVEGDVCFAVTLPKYSRWDLVETDTTGALIYREVAE